jgi:hypothetical protein
VDYFNGAGAHVGQLVYIDKEIAGRFYAIADWLHKSYRFRITFYGYRVSGYEKDG